MTDSNRHIRRPSRTTKLLNHTLTKGEFCHFRAPVIILVMISRGLAKQLLPWPWPSPGTLGSRSLWLFRACIGRPEGKKKRTEPSVIIRNHQVVSKQFFHSWMHFHAPQNYCAPHKSSDIQLICTNKVQISLCPPDMWGICANSGFLHSPNPQEIPQNLKSWSKSVEWAAFREGIKDYFNRGPVCEIK